MRPTLLTPTRYLRLACLLIICVGTTALGGCSGKTRPFAKNKTQHTVSLAAPSELAPSTPLPPIRTIPVPVTQNQAGTSKPHNAPVRRPHIASLKIGRPIIIDPKAQQQARRPATANLHTASISKPQNHKPTVALKPVRGASAEANHIFMQTLQQQLSRAGYAITELPQQNTPFVSGTVQMGAAARNKQSVTLTWQVHDAKGDRIGTVIQKNHIPRRSISGTWAGNARHAANAAIPGIVKLLNQARD